MQSSLKKSVQGALKRAGIYHRVKSSRLYDLYWTVADRQLLIDRDRELAFYRGLLDGLRPGDLIFDIGANEGHKTDIFLRLGARVAAIEPDPDNQQILRQRFLTHRIKPRPVTVIGKAVSDRNGLETMWIDEPGSAKNTLNPKWVETLRSDASRFGRPLQFAGHREVETITLDELMKSTGVPTFIKIDVEGHEARVLQSMSRPVRYVSFEANLPEFKPEAIECIKLLEGVSAGGEFNFTSDCRHGLGLELWLPGKAFLDVLNSCAENSIEIFWRCTNADECR